MQGYPLRFDSFRYMMQCQIRVRLECRVKNKLNPNQNHQRPPWRKRRVGYVSESGYPSRLSQLCLSAGQGCEPPVRREIESIKQPMTIHNIIIKKSNDSISVGPGYEDQAHRDMIHKTANRKMPNWVLLAYKKHPMTLIH